MSEASSASTSPRRAHVGRLVSRPRSSRRTRFTTWRAREVLAEEGLDMVSDSPVLSKPARCGVDRELAVRRSTPGESRMVLSYFALLRRQARTSRGRRRSAGLAVVESRTRRGRRRLAAAGCFDASSGAFPGVEAAANLLPEAGSHDASTLSRG